MLNKSWTINLIRRYGHQISPLSLLKYRAYVLRENAGAAAAGQLLNLRLRGLIRGDVWLREGSTDFATFDELLITRVYDRLLSNVASAEYIVDLGANIGLATRIFATRFPRAKVASVEADGANFGILKRNVAQLEAEGRSIPFHRAIWGENVSLAVVRSAVNVESNSRISVGQNPAEGDQSVQGITMDEVLAIAKFPRIDILKIDVEGAEVELFKGDLGWLDRTQKIAIEFHGDSRERSGFDRAMSERGFEIDDDDPHTVIATRRQNPSGSAPLEATHVSSPHR